MAYIKKIICVLLTLCVIASCVAFGSTSTLAADSPVPFDSEHPELAQATIQDGAILHCFCWSYNTIKEHLSEIKAAGYTAVQTSPVQPPKDYSPSYTDVKGNWWKLYQPLDLSVTDGSNFHSWLGTKSELTSLCSEAEEMGIKVIIDIVSNHVANKADINEEGTDYYPTYVNDGVAAFFKDKNVYYPNIGSCSKESDNPRYQTTHGHLGMPELDTSNKNVQAKVLSFMKECVDCGVDGFRFDTAKHIELPTDDDDTKSDYWPTIINGINEYQSDKGGDPLYIYGEILGDAGSKSINKEYAEYMDLTEDTSTYFLRKSFRNNSIDSNAGSKNEKQIEASQSVLWAESHDTYLNDNGNSQNDTLDTIVRTWAIINSRADTTSLFFVRPGEMVNNQLASGKMGSANSDLTWKSTAVVESNKFKNLFVGKDECLTLDNSKKVVYNERGTKGIVISKLSGSGEVSLTVNKMADGIYLDHVSNTNFIVSNGVITGTVADCGVAVIYNENDIEDSAFTQQTLFLKPENDDWNVSGVTQRYAMYVYNSTTNDNAWISMNDSDNDGIYEANVPAGSWTGVIFCRMKGETTENNWNNKWNKTANLFPTGNNTLFTVTKKDDNYDINKEYKGSWSYFGGVAVDTPTGLGGTLYLDFSTQNTWWANDNARLYAYFFNSNVADVNEWVLMENVTDVQNMRKVEIPDGTWNRIVFTRWDNVTSHDKWDAIWNQTIDLTIPSADSGNNCFVFDGNSQDNSSVERKARSKTGDWGIYPDDHTHTYAESWEWSDNNTKAELTLSCGCGRKLYFEKSITPVSDEEKDVFTATVRYDGNSYSDTQTVYKQPTFEGASAVINDNIGLYFYFDFHQFQSSEATLTFTHKGVITTAELKQAPEPYDAYYRAVCPVAAKEMGDTVVATLTIGEDTYTYESTAAAYLRSLYKNENGEAGNEGESVTEALKTLARSMLNYGAKAQTQFGYKCESEYDLVDYDLDTYSPQSIPDDIDVLSYIDNQFADYGLKYVGSSMLLRDTITYRLFFTKNDDETADNTVVSYNGKYIEPISKGSYVCYDITGIKAPDLLDNRTLKFTNGENSASADFTPANYLKGSHNGSSESLKNITEALYDYNKKSIAYFALVNH